MDRIQKGVCMEKAKAFNEIVKLCKLNDNKLFKECIQSTVDKTFDVINKIKNDNKGKN